MGIMVKKIYECQNVEKIIILTETLQIERVKYTNLILKPTPVRFNQTITHLLVVLKETTFSVKMISTQKSFPLEKKKAETP